MKDPARQTILSQFSVQSPQFCIVVTERSQIAQARSAAAKLARGLGFAETEEGKVALVVTEMATNLVKHTTGGQLLIHDRSQAKSPRIELLALDKGPGMMNVVQCFRDGYSTTGSPGTGLGAILRTSSLVDFYSTSALGTAVFARLGKEEGQQGREEWQKGKKLYGSAPSQPRFPNPQPLEVGVVCLAKPGEEVSGDAWAVEQRPGRSLFMVADGLGHGPGAAEAAQEAVRVFHARSAQAPAEIITAAHAALRATRGAAVAVTEIDRTKQQVRFCGVGNIATAILTALESRSMVSYEGIIGHNARKIQEFTYPWSPDALLVMHSDGLATRWSLTPYSGLSGHHPGLIAGVLYRDFRREKDDVTVLTAKEY